MLSNKKLNVGGDITIEYANSVLDIKNASGFSNGNNKITIQNCNQYGVYISNCSPTVRDTLCDNITGESSVICVFGNTADPSIRRSKFVNPNPSNPFTTITYLINEPSQVILNVYSINGQKVATLVDNTMNVGTHTVTFDGSHLGSGTYFYRFESKGFRKTGKIILVK